MIIGLAILLFVKWRTHKYILCGSLFFLIHIALLLQLVQVGNTIMADRYSYVSYVGLFLIASYGLLEVLKRKMANYQVTYFAIALLLVSGYAYAAHERCRIWKNSETLWTDVIRKQPSVPDAYNNLGTVYYKQAENYINTNQPALAAPLLERAYKKYDEAIALNPKFSIAWWGRSLTHFHKQEYQAAFTDINQAILLNPANDEFYNSRANIYFSEGMWREAINDYQKTLALNPQHAWAWNNAGHCYSQMERYDSAIACYDRMLRIQPTFADTYVKRAFVWYKLKNYPRAFDDCNKGINLDNRNAEAYHLRSILYFENGNKSAAREDAMKARQLGAQLPEDYLRQVQE